METLQMLIETLGPLAWVMVIGSFVFMFAFLGFFVWIWKKFMDDFNKF